MKYNKKIIVIGCNYHTTWQYKKQMRFVLKEVKGKDSTWEQAFDLLQGLSRVERTEVGFGNEVKTWYLNVTKSINDKLKKIGMKDLLKDEIKLKM